LKTLLPKLGGGFVHGTLYIDDVVAAGPHCLGQQLEIAGGKWGTRPCPS
jgi:hypothetical protein